MTTGQQGDDREKKGDTAEVAASIIHSFVDSFVATDAAVSLDVDMMDDEDEEEGNEEEGDEEEVPANMATLEESNSNAISSVQEQQQPAEEDTATPLVLRSVSVTMEDVDNLELD